MATPQQSTLNIINKNSYVRLTGSGDYNVNSKNLYLNSHGYLQLQADNDTIFKTTNGNTIFTNETGIIKLEALSNLPNTIIINASNNDGSVLIHSGSNGITLESNNGGDTNIYSYGGNINIGYDGVGSENDTQYITIDSAIHTYIGSSDIDIHASDQINILSDTGNIFIGSSTGDPFLTFENGNLLLNQSNSSLDYQLDVRITDQSDSNHGHNGVAVNTSNSDIAAEIVLMASHINNTNGNIIPDAKLSIGTQPANSNSSYYQEYLAYQDGSNVIAISGVEFNSDDIGRNIYWPSHSKQDTIINLSSKLLPGSNADISSLLSPTPTGSNIVVYGTYTGSTSTIYLIEIDTANVDANGNPTNDIPTFKWSDNGGSTFNEKLILLKDYSQGSYDLNNGIKVKFPAIEYTYQQQFIFNAKITAVVETTDNTITLPTKLYTLQPYYSYIKTSTGEDIVIGTNNTEKMRITGDGAISIQNTRPDAGMHIDSKYGSTLQVNQYSDGYQLNSTVSAITTGGYVIAWQSTYTDTNDQYTAVNGNIWVQRYMTDGSRFGDSMQINSVSSIGATINNIFPSVANNRYPGSSNYMVVWASGNTSTPASYNILGRIIKYNQAYPTSDIQIANIVDNNELYPKVSCILKYNNLTGEYVSKYVVVWAETNGLSPTTSVIKCRLFDDSGVGGSVTSITSTGVSKYPSVMGLSSIDPYHPGGFVVSYMTATDINSDQFVVKFKVVDVNNDGTIGTIGSEVTIQDGSTILYSDGLQSMDYISNGGFVISMYENYVNDPNYYIDGYYIKTDDKSVFGSIQSHTITPTYTTITVQFTIGILTTNQEFRIIDSATPSNTLLQSVDTITWVSNDTAVIKLNFGHHAIVAYAFNSNASILSDKLWVNRSVNTSRLYDDVDRTSATINPNSIFAYTRPTAQISINDTGSCMVAWSSGTIPHLYYSILNSSSGEIIGEEALVSTDNLGIKHRNASLTYLMSIQGNDYGHIISWDNQNLNQSGTGIYQCLIGYNHYIFKAEDHTSNMCLTHNGRLGIGVLQPTDTLHVKSNGMRTNYARSETGLLRLQNNIENVNTSSLAQLSINMADGNNNTLATISACNVPEYVGMFPYPDNMVLFYDFDSAENELILRDRTWNNIDASLVNFDTENCWNKNGLINTCLEFNGAISSNVYAFANNNTSEITKIFSNSKATISAWIKVPSVFQTDDYIGSNITILSTGDSSNQFGTKGTYSFDVYNRTPTNPVSSSPYLTLGFTIYGETLQNFNILGDVSYDTARLTPNEWHFVSIVYNSSEPDEDKFKLYMDGTTFPTTITPLINFDQTNLPHLNIGVKCATTYEDYFIGYMNQIKAWSNITLSANEQLELYNFSKTGAILKNALYFNTHNTLTNQNIFIDNTNSINGLSCRSSDFSVIYGSNAVITVNSTELLVSSSADSVDTYVKLGDTIKLSTSGSELNNNGNEFNVIDIINVSNETSQLILDRPPSKGAVGTVNTNKQLLCKPSILSMIDYNSKLCGFVDYNGNAVFGSSSSLNNKLTIAADPSTSIEYPCMTLVNNNASSIADFQQIYNSRGSKINFKGYKLSDSNIAEIASITAYNYQWNNDTSTGNVGSVIFKVNSGNGYNINENVEPILSITGNSCVGINTHKPRTNLNVCSNDDDKSPIILLSSNYNNPHVFSSNSFIKFGSNNDNDFMDTGFSGIQGSRDSHDSTYKIGRLDFCTNRSNDNYVLEKNMSIDSQGNVGVNMIAPMAPFHAAPKYYSNSNNTFTIETPITSSSIKINVGIGNSISESDKSALIGGYIIINNSYLSRSKIISIEDYDTNKYTITVADGSLTCSILDTCELHYPGLIVGYNGNVIMDTMTSRTITTENELILEGALRTSGIINISNTNYNVSTGDYIILSSTTSDLTANLNAIRTIDGKNLIIKNIYSSSKNIIIESGSGSDTYEDNIINEISGYAISVASMETIRLVCQYSGGIANWWRI